MTFRGFAFGDVEAEAQGEVIFNTATGYQEALTDPSYYGQNPNLYLSAYRQLWRECSRCRIRDHANGGLDCAGIFANVPELAGKHSLAEFYR